MDDQVDDQVETTGMSSPTDPPEPPSTGKTSAAAGPRRPSTRRRRANAPGGRRHKHEVKVTPEEEALLLQLAASQRVTIPRLLVESALAGGAETSSQRRNAIEELFAVHRLLAQVSNNVNQIARATNATLETQPETYAVLAAVRRAAERVDEAAEALIVDAGQTRVQARVQTQVRTQRQGEIG